MQVVEIKGPGGPEVLVAAERETPIPGADEVLIEVKAAGVNRPDVVQRLGFYPPPPGASDIPGLEVAGTVAAVGKNCHNLSVGDKVCALVTGGGYASHCLAPVETVVKMPAGFSFVDAAAIPETYFTVWSNLFDRAQLKEGETLLVHGGSSGIGSTAIQLAKAFGVTVITTAGSADKVAFCEGLGADLAINYKEYDYVELVENFTRGRGVDVVLDMVGGDYINQNISVMAPDGRHVSIAFLSGPQVSINMMPVMLKRLTLTGSTLRARDGAFKSAIAAKLTKHVWPLLEAGSVKPQIDSVFPWNEANKAHALMESSNHMGKIMLSFE
jgi:NADPH2:quinone reductase